MSVTMALIDFIPVIFFVIATVILQHDLYNKMSKGAFALYAGGTIFVICAGIYKAFWKLLYGAGICDFQLLSKCFMPMQSTGFALIAIGMIAMLIAKQSNSNEKLYSVAAVPAVFSGTMIFVAMMVFGVIVNCSALSVLSAKLKKKGLVVLFIVVIFGMLGMGYMSSKDSMDPMMNWIAQGINCVSQGLYLLGVYLLHKAGLKELKLKTS